jgi:leucyl/phenylalanyl-tRNA--protein transferase
MFHYVGAVTRFDPETILDAYARGMFPMGDVDGSLHWIVSDPRYVLPVGRLHVPRSLARLARTAPFDIRLNTAFRAVMEHCAADRGDASTNWITPRMIDVYEVLHRRGFAHSVEAWRAGVLVGGLYGVSLGGAFFGESMFTRRELGGANASKLCLLALDRMLVECGFTLLDSQEKNEHMAQFGGEEVAFEEFEDRLSEALLLEPPALPVGSRT